MKIDKGTVIRLGVVSFWMLFWLFNVIDKFITNAGFLWVGKNRLAQFTEYFSSIGIENSNVALGFLSFVAVAEFIAFILMAMSVWYLIARNEKKSDSAFFWGSFMGLTIFSLFTIGDQVFGERHELLEHTTYWMAIIISWGAYAYYPKILKK